MLRASPGLKEVADLAMLTDEDIEGLGLFSAEQRSKLLAWLADGRSCAALGC